MERDMEYYIQVTNQVMSENLKNRNALTSKICTKYIHEKAKNICIIASGSSLNAALAARPFMRKIMECDVCCITPTEYIYYKKNYVKEDFIIAISQSGCSTNIIDAVKVMNDEGIDYVALTGNQDSDLRDYTSELIEYGVGNEIIDYVTLGMTTLIEFLILFATETSMRKATISNNMYKKIINDIDICCTANEKMLCESGKLTESYKDELMKMDKAFIVTDYPNMAIAREGALKFGETLKIPTLYYESEEFIHGPNMQLTPDYSVFFIDVSNNGTRMNDICKATRIITENTYLITNKKINNMNRTIYVEANVMEELTPLFTAVLFQYISAHLTPEKNDFKCHYLFDKFEKVIKCKTDNYDEIMKAKKERIT